MLGRCQPVLRCAVGAVSFLLVVCLCVCVCVLGAGMCLCQDHQELETNAAEPGVILEEAGSLLGFGFHGLPW